MRKTIEMGRDRLQKSLGCMGFSALAHIGILIALASVPGAMANKVETPAGVPDVQEAKGDAPLVLDLAPNTAPQAQTAASTAVPMQAAAGDTTAVAVPKSALEKPARKPVAKAVAKPVVKAVAPVVADTEGDVEVQAALERARKQHDMEKPQAVEPDEEEQVVKSPAIVPMDESAENEPVIVAANEAPSPVAAPVAAAPAKVAVPVAPKPIAQPAPQAVAAPGTSAPAKVAAPQAPIVSQRVVAAPPAGGSGPQAAASQTAVQAAPQVTRGPGGQGSSLASSGNGVGVGPTLGAAVVNADLLREKSGPRPPYPMQDRIGHRNGVVVVRATVLADGTVSNVRLEQSSGSAQMDTAAVSTYYHWKYFPGQAGEVRKRFLFQLDGNAETRYAKLRRGP